VATIDPEEALHQVARISGVLKNHASNRDLDSRGVAEVDRFERKS